MRAESIAAHKGGMWSWILQRVTAVLVIVTLAIHLIFTHIIGIGDISFNTIGERLIHAGFIAVDIILLASAIFHAFNGFRLVLMDYWFSSRTRAMALSIVLWVVGLAAMAYGTWALWPWIS